MDDLISRQAAIDALDKRFDSIPMEQTTEILLLRKDLRTLPAAQPTTDEWCTDCKEYDSEKHCCPRWNRVIRQTAEDMKAAQPHWIPVMERLPEYGTRVLTIHKDGDYEINHVIDEEDGEWFLDGVIAWMPLPEPYKGGEQE